MLTKTIKYTDYDGNEREETFRFNLTKAELATMEMSVKGGLRKYLEKAVEDQDNTKIFAVFKDMVDRSYGEKSNDGREFRKSPEILESFRSTEAYNALFMEIVTDEKFALAFFDGITPPADNKPQLLPNA